MAGLLVSVRSVPEAVAALAGGAALIDIKEPARGPLGRADDSTIAAIVRQVAGRRPVSAALGELLDGLALYPGDGLSHVKWGLAGSDQVADWRDHWLRAVQRLRERPAASCPVLTAYADWRRASSPSPAEVVEFACTQRGLGLLFDTCVKDGTTLLDWVALPEIVGLVRCCRDQGIPVALAGSLGEAQIVTLRPCEPDWFAVRGAVCPERRRDAAIEPERVRRLVQLLE